DLDEPVGVGVGGVEGAVVPREAPQRRGARRVDLVHVRLRAGGLGERRHGEDGEGEGGANERGGGTVAEGHRGGAAGGGGWEKRGGGGRGGGGRGGGAGGGGGWAKRRNVRGKGPPRQSLHTSPGLRPPCTSTPSAPTASPARPPPRTSPSGRTRWCSRSAAR